MSRLASLSHSCRPGGTAGTMPPSLLPPCKRRTRLPCTAAAICSTQPRAVRLHNRAPGPGCWAELLLDSLGGCAASWPTLHAQMSASKANVFQVACPCPACCLTDLLPPGHNHIARRPAPLQTAPPFTGEPRSASLPTACEQRAARQLATASSRWSSQSTSPCPGACLSRAACWLPCGPQVGGALFGEH